MGPGVGRHGLGVQDLGRDVHPAVRTRSQGSYAAALGASSTDLKRDQRKTDLGSEGRGISYRIEKILSAA